MKDVVLIGLCAIALAAWVNSLNNMNKISKLQQAVIKLDSTNTAINKQLEAQAIHFEDCAFISREDVAINSNGYFYSIENRRW